MKTEPKQALALTFLGRSRFILACLVSLTACAEQDAAAEPAAVAARMLDLSIEPLTIHEGGQLGPRFSRLAQAALECDPNAQAEIVDVCGDDRLGAARFEWEDCTIDLPEGLRADELTSSGYFEFSSESAQDCNDGTTFLTRSSWFSVQNEPRPGIVVTASGSVTASHAQDGVLIDLAIDRELTNDDRGGSATTAVHGRLEAVIESELDAVTLNGTLSMGVHHPYWGEVDHELELIDLRRVSQEQCEWPIAGTIVRDSEGENHTIEFGPECGVATLDGEAIELDEFGGFGRHGRASRRPF